LDIIKQSGKLLVIYAGGKLPVST